jgi:hypothetical protein
VLTTSRYTRLTSCTDHNAKQAINELMNGFFLSWGNVQ